MRIVIVMEKCLIQAVFADVPDSRCAIADLDTDGIDPDRLLLTPHGRECTIEFEEPECEPRCVERVFESEHIGDVPRVAVLQMASALADIIASHDNWRECADQCEALRVWSETVGKARRALDRTTGLPARQEEPSDG